MMKLVTKFQLEVSSSLVAEKVVKSLQSDIVNTSDFFDRSSLQISANMNTIELEIKASDIVAAKASINSCLLWLENSINLIEKYTNNKKNS